jgi:hypothetical protein
MIESFIIGIGGVVTLLVMWVVVQSWWGKVFADNITDDDVLAGRTKCSNCGCTTVCENKTKQLSTE